MILTTWTLADGTTGERSINAPLQEVLDRVWRKFGDTSKPLGGGSEFDRVNAEGKASPIHEAIHESKAGRSKGRNMGSGASKQAKSKSR